MEQFLCLPLSRHLLMRPGEAVGVATEGEEASMVEGERCQHLGPALVEVGQRLLPVHGVADSSLRVLGVADLSLPLHGAADLSLPVRAGLLPLGFTDRLPLAALEWQERVVHASQFGQGCAVGGLSLPPVYEAGL